MNHELLEKWNHHVAIGDILLLTHRGVEAMVIKRYQSMKRRLPARYTHVAVVISPDMVIDAMPPEGVSFRPWTAMEADYDIENCCVARNKKLASNPDAPKLLWQRAIYYYRQPYNLRALISPPENLTDQAGIVCSQFVVLLLHDVGVEASDRLVFETLPIDIDTVTQTSPDWRQFPLIEYGLCSKCCNRINSAEYREDLTRAFPIRLSAEQEQEANRMAEEFFKKDFSEGINEFPSGSDKLLAELEELRRQGNDRLLPIIENMYSTSGLAQQLDDMTVQFMHLIAEQASSHGDVSTLAGQLKESFPEMEGCFPSNGNALSGATLLSVWRGLFLAKHMKTPIFLHAERAAGNHIERCAFFKKNLVSAKSVADFYSKQFETFMGCISDLEKFAKGGVLNREVVQSVRNLAEYIMSGSEFLCGEIPEEVHHRINNYEVLVEELKASWSSSDVDMKLKEDSKDCLFMIWELDIERQSWSAFRQPALLSFLKVLKSMEARF